MPERDTVVAETRVQTSAGSLYVKQWGKTKRRADVVPIVLLHDSLGCVELWRDFPRHLFQAVGHPVIAYDRLGFGRSDAHPGILDNDFIRQEARGGFAAVIEQLEIDRFIVFGHSVGGGMAVSIAAAWPDRCCGVITESAQAFVEDRTIAGIRSARQNFADPEQLDRLRKYHGDKAPWVLSAWTETWLSPEFANWNLDSELEQVGCPILAIHGDRDEFGTTQHPARIASIAGQRATQACLPECGHVPHREQEQAVLQLVARFIETLTL